MKHLLFFLVKSFEFKRKLHHTESIHGGLFMYYYCEGCLKNLP